MKSIFQLLARPRSVRLAALLVGLLIAMAGMRAAEAQRATRTTSKSGVTTSTWKAKGTTFRHENQKMHGKTVHWERAWSGKNGVTKLRGKTWGSSYTGFEFMDGPMKVRQVTVKGSDGSTRKVTTSVDQNGTTRSIINIRAKTGATTEIREVRAADGTLTERRERSGP